MPPTELNSKEIDKFFGSNSKLFNEIYDYLNHQKIDNKEFIAKFSKWKKLFNHIYDIGDFSKLFIKQTYYILIVKGIYVYKYNKINAKKKESDPNSKYKTFYQLFQSEELSGNQIREFEYYNWTSLNENCLKLLFDILNNYSYNTSTIFHLLYEGIFSNQTRHFMGEFYTPSKLVKKMIDYNYHIGDKVLDPSCGSGNFLIGIILKIINSENPNLIKIKAIKNIYGFDINPLAIYTVKIHILIILLNKLADFPIKIIENNFLMLNSLSCETIEVVKNQNLEKLYDSFDLIIGNPPWLTYKDADESLRKRLKEISAKFNIKPAANNITNIEEAVVFLYYLPYLFLKKTNNSNVAFVMPKSILVSSHNQKARTFNIFKKVEIHTFDNSMFNIDFCCLIASMKDPRHENEETMFKTYPIKCKVFNSESMKILEEYTLEPYVYFRKSDSSQFLVKKLIKSELKKDLLPSFLSDYYDEFIQGADLLPKSLLYVEILDKQKNQELCVIDPWISPQAKGKWKKKYYSNERVECKHLFKATLSRGLYPFYICPYDIFLPLNKYLEYNLSDLGIFARKHWDLIAEIYKRLSGNDLFSRGINYRNKLCKKKTVREEQRKPYKVVFPNAKTLMSAVIEDHKGKVFLDSTLYYYGTENKREAYYLCGMLNIRNLFKSVKLISDTRHHHKRPLYFNIPKFQGTDQQLKIASLAKECTNIVANYISSVNSPRVSQIWKITQEKRKSITNIGLPILKSVEGINILKI
ncbi:MAG: hypothetical protein EU547_02115 [Promethearchaeota archaeon]|nr:MAG: hypothetical protein EU547_02115 [Candidatus Lokiarchaeota archaeon]